MLKFTVLVCLQVLALAQSYSQFDEVFEWKSIEYDWPSPNELDQVLKNKEYIEANNSISGIKVWKDNMYLTIPRWRSGVPVTLGVISLVNITSNDSVHTDILLNPYPNWDMQTLGDCTAFQSVISMEIDPLGRMWVIDTGRTEILNVKPVTKCPPRLFILDLENNGELLRSYAFPEEVAKNVSVYLNDIVLDHDNGGWAFISDSANIDPGIIVYSVRDNKSWKVKHESMKNQTEAVHIKVGNNTIKLPTNIDGIALSPPGPDRQLYYSPLSSFHMYSIAVSILQNSSLRIVEDFDVTDLGRKRSQTGRMVMSNQGSLYVGFLADDAIGSWDSKNNPTIDTRLKKITPDHSIPNWPDAFAIDEEGWLWCVTNNYPNYFTNHVNISVVNYRVIRSFINEKNYQYFENGTAPELPDANEAADRMVMAFYIYLMIIALVFFTR